MNIGYRENTSSSTLTGGTVSKRTSHARPKQGILKTTKPDAKGSKHSKGMGGDVISLCFI